MESYSSRMETVRKENDKVWKRMKFNAIFNRLIKGRHFGTTDVLHQTRRASFEDAIYLISLENAEI